METFDFDSPYLHGYVSCRAVGRSENPGVPVLFGGNNLPPLVEIGLTDLPKSEGGGMALPAPPRDDRPAGYHQSDW